MAVVLIALNMQFQASELRMDWGKIYEIEVCNTEQGTDGSSAVADRTSSSAGKGAGINISSSEVKINLLCNWL